MRNRPKSFRKNDFAEGISLTRRVWPGSPGLSLFPNFRFHLFGSLIAELLFVGSQLFEQLQELPGVHLLLVRYVF